MREEGRSRDAVLLKQGESFEAKNGSQQSPRVSERKSRRNKLSRAKGNTFDLSAIKFVFWKNRKKKREKYNLIPFFFSDFLKCS